MSEIPNELDVLRDISKRLDAAGLLSKLAWHSESGSERQLSDIRNLLATGFDADYVTRWVRDLGLAESWKHATSG